MSGSIDTCEILIFISKTDNLIPGIENKKVDLDSSYVNLELRTLSLKFSKCGVVETLMEVELAGGGGLQVRGWLEGPAGKVLPNSSSPLTFPIINGATYELVSAVFGRDRQLSRLKNFTIQVPEEMRPRYRRKYGDSVPLRSLVQGEGRPLSFNFDIAGK